MNNKKIVVCMADADTYHAVVYIEDNKVIQYNHTSAKGERTYEYDDEKNNYDIKVDILFDTNEITGEYRCVRASINIEPMDELIYSYNIHTHSLRGKRIDKIDEIKEIADIEFQDKIISLLLKYIYYEIVLGNTTLDKNLLDKLK